MYGGFEMLVIEKYLGDFMCRLDIFSYMNGFFLV